MRRDSQGFLVDEVGDGGDSARYEGIFTLFSPTKDNSNVIYYVDEQGLGVRHPYQKPWDNPNNFTRDQLICLMAGLWADNDILSRLDAKAVLRSHARRWFLCQNFERDVPGSKKMLRPHEFYKDSRPDATTLPMKFDWKSLKFKQTLFSNENHKVETRLLDGRDILLPDAIWHLILCARARQFYLFGFIGIPWLCLSILGHRLSGHKEHNQIICQCVVAGQWARKLFKWAVPDYKLDLYRYWVRDRQDIETYTMIEKGF